jgi:outer membrane protein assembly factor BamE
MTNKKQKYDDIILMQFADNELDKKTYKQLEEDLKTNNELQKRLSVYTLTRSALKNKENYQIPEKLNKLINQSVENKKILRFVKKHHFQFFPASVNFTLVIVFFGVLASLIAPIIKNNLNNDILFENKADISPTPYKADIYQGSVKADISPTPYKADIYQGSVLERFKINQLKVGMSKAQVQDLIGSPSVIDPFHNNQWDYINYSTPGTGSIVHYRLTLAFDNTTLTKINTTGIDSLPQLTDAEKALEGKRIAEEKAKVEAAAEAKRIEEANRPWYKFW